MRSSLHFLVAFSASLLAGPLSAQNAHGLHLIARNASDGVVLRWAPSDHIAWQGGNGYGYRVERYTIDKSLKRGQKPQVISPDTLRPWSLEKFRSGFPKDHPWAPVAAQSLYGKSFAPASSMQSLKGAVDASQEQAMRYSFAVLAADLASDVADALALRWVDHDVVPDGDYLYRVIGLDPSHADTAWLAVDRRRGADALPVAPELRANSGEGRIALEWTLDIGREDFTAYWIERSSNGKEWSRVNERPFIPMDESAGKKNTVRMFTDTTIARDYLPYHYRLLGITPFGEVSVPSAPIIAMGRDRTPPPSPVINDVKDEKGKLVVHWSMSATPRDLKGFRVEKAFSANGPYWPLNKEVLRGDARSFADTSLDLGGENHYRVYALDTAGNSSVSLNAYGFLLDSIAPLAPTGLAGRIDTNGVVTLNWHRGKENDILGYRVFFANAVEHEFTNRTGDPWCDTTYIDTISLRTLTKRIFYKVVALDRNYNHSPVSAMLELERPDIVAPVAPVFADYRVTDTSVVITYVPSASADVATYRLFRAEQGKNNWRTLSSWPTVQVRSVYIDTTVEQGTFYSYTMQVADSAGNLSDRNIPINVRVYRRMKEKSVTGVRAVWDASAKEVIVAWTAVPQGVERYVIYRSRDGGAWGSIGSVNGAVPHFTDQRTTGSGTYAYRVQTGYASGAVSRMSAVPAAVRVD